MNEEFRLLAEYEPRNAPASVEKALLAEFRKRKAARRWMMGAVVTTAAGAIAAGLFAVAMLRIPEPPAPAFHLVRISPPAVVGTVAVSHRRRTRRPARGPEVASAFYTLPGSAMLPPLDFGTVVRVELPRSALMLVGFPVNEDRAFERVRADVLLGQDGQARAVRFIQ